MQAVFMDNWIKATGEVLHGDDYFPALEPAGDGRAQMFSSSPTGGSESMQLMYLLSITAAQRSDRPVERVLRARRADASTRWSRRAKRGVKVRIIVPGDAHRHRRRARAPRARAGATLLEAGVEIYEYQPTMFHCKVMIVDELLVSVGSTNFDNRSFRLNDEANLNVSTRSSRAEQVEIFEHDLARSKRGHARRRGATGRGRSGRWSGSGSC